MYSYELVIDITNCIIKTNCIQILPNKSLVYSKYSRTKLNKREYHVHSYSFSMKIYQCHYSKHFFDNMMLLVQGPFPWLVLLEQLGRERPLHKTEESKAFADAT